MQPHNRNLILALIYFTLSVLITGWFIEQKFWFFASASTIFLSNCIAISKWAIQIIAALLLLKDKKWIFIERISFACFASSCMLFSVYLFKFFPLSSWDQFKYTMTTAVLAMLILYYKAVVDTGLSRKWYIGWLVCIIISVFLQTKVVFK